MRIALLLVILSVSLPAYAEQPCINFDGENYCLAWTSVDGVVTSNEYVRSTETVDKWSRMITVKSYADTSALKDVLPAYMNYVRPMLALKPDIFRPNQKKHDDEAALLLLLLAPDKSHYEYVVHHIYVDKNHPVSSVIFSLRIPFAEKISYDDVMKNRSQWLAELYALEPAIYTSLPGQPQEPAKAQQK